MTPLRENPVPQSSPATSEAPLIRVVRRQVDLWTFKANGDPVPLMAISRAALQECLDSFPTQASFVTPQATVSATSSTPAFYAAANKHKCEWCTLLNRTLGNANVRHSLKAAHPETYALTFRGLLLVDGKLFWPGCWPNQSPRRAILKRTPFQAATLPPEFLGLIVSQEATSLKSSASERKDSDV
jgi:hypothetical protein